MRISDWSSDVCSSDLRALPEQRGFEGRLKVRGAAVVERYFGDSENATNDGWFDTGDLARIDARGNVTITGRAKDLIKSGGEWINPAEIEEIGRASCRERVCQYV